MVSDISRSVLQRSAAYQRHHLARRQNAILFAPENTFELTPIDPGVLFLISCHQTPEPLLRSRSISLSKRAQQISACTTPFSILHPRNWTEAALRKAIDISQYTNDFTKKHHNQIARSVALTTGCGLFQPLNLSGTRSPPTFVALV